MISAVAQKYNIHPQTLRLYEREGLLKPSRTEGNTRLYSEEDLEQLETILSLTRDLGVNLAGVEIILNMRRKIEQMQHEVNEFMEYVKRELARGIDDWEQRLSTALVKSSPTDLVRTTPPQLAARTRKSASSSVTRSSLTRNFDSCIVTASIAASVADMSCPLCDDTGWKPVDDDGVAPRRALRLLARARRAPAPRATRTFRKRYQHCTLANFTAYNESLEKARRAGAPRRRRVSRSVDSGLLLEGQPGVGKTHLAVAVLKQVIQTTGARGLFYDTRDLLRVIRSTYDPSIRTTELEVLRPGDDRRSARARRSRRREDVRMGRGDDEPDRQHALQRAAADDLHVELPGHPRRHRSELAAVPHRPPDAVAAARDVRVRRCSTAPTTASCRPTAATDDLIDAVEDAQARTLPSPPRQRAPGARRSCATARPT